MPPKSKRKLHLAQAREAKRRKSDIACSNQPEPSDSGSDPSDQPGSSDIPSTIEAECSYGTLSSSPSSSTSSVSDDNVYMKIGLVPFLEMIKCL